MAERLLDAGEQAPERATMIRVLLMELRDRSPANLRTLPALAEGGGGLLADVIAAIASRVPVLGGIGR